MKNNITEKAIAYVRRYEIRHHRKPHRLHNGGWDIESGKRKIEVKGTENANPRHVGFSSYNFRAMRRAGDSFYFYFVYNIRPGKRYELKVFTSEQIRKMKRRLRAADYWLLLPPESLK